GAGKTTLLRALAGEISLEAGELAWEKGARVALHDQRPPATSAQPLRGYVLSGTADLAALAAERRELETAMAGGAHDARTRGRYAGARTRPEHAGGSDDSQRAPARGRRRCSSSKAGARRSSPGRGTCGGASPRPARGTRRRRRSGRRTSSRGWNASSSASATRRRRRGRRNRG